MAVPFSELPGRHERHFRRKLKNALFPRPIERYGDDDLLEVQRLDHEELLAFLTELRATVQRAVDLGGTEESQVVLDLKSDLERLYEVASGLADDQEGNKAAIRQLTAVIMATVSRGAEGDALAARELKEEAMAREAHFSMLGHPLVADLLHPESVIAPDEFIPTLLCEEEGALVAALELFDVEQLSVICGDAEQMLRSCDPDGSRFPGAVHRLDIMERVLSERGGMN